MSEKSLPNFRALEQALNKTALKLHPSQVHGLVCGILCGHPHSRATAWEELVTGGKETGKTHQLLEEVYEVSAHQLDEFLFEFQLILPSAPEELPVRAEALTLWCQGVLTGLKLAKVQIVDREPGEITEAIEDLVEIAKMNYEEVVASEEDETAYTELVEFVRMAVILIYQTMHEKSGQDHKLSSNTHLH